MAQNKKEKELAEDPVIANEIASEKRAATGEAYIEVYDEVLPGHRALEDEAEISSTDDV